MTNLYAYGLSDGGLTAAFEEGAGVGGAKPFLIDAGDLRAVVSEFEGERAGVTRENLRAHNRVLGRVLAVATPLPFRFGTIVAAARLVQYMEANREALHGALGRVSGCVEMSVKIMWQAEELRREAEMHAAARPPTAATTPGAAYLLAKRRALAGSDALKAKAAEIAAWLARALGDAVRESRVEIEPERELVVRAAHLVGRARLEEYRERLRAARAERGRELRFLTSGAWPPYSFSDVSTPTERLP